MSYSNMPERERKQNLARNAQFSPVFSSPSMYLPHAGDTNTSSSTRNIVTVKFLRIQIIIMRTDDVLHGLLGLSLK